MFPGKNTSVTHVTEHIVTHVTCFDTVFFITKILAEINECMLTGLWHAGNLCLNNETICLHL